MRAIHFKTAPKTISAIFVCLLFLSACKQNQPDPSLKPAFSFTYTFDQEGDGLVTFTADSTLEGGEYVWRFGANSVTVSTTHPVIRNTFPDNGQYEVNVTYKTQTGALSATQTISVNNRLARKFDDLPADQRDTIRILCVLTHESFAKEFEDPKTTPSYPYQNQVFINFLNRTLPDHPREMNNLVLKKIVYKLSPQEMNRFNEAGDPVVFLDRLLAQREDPLFQNIMNEKRSKAVSRIAFYLKDPAPGGFSKYGIGGYALYEGSYFVLLSPGSYVHELGHSFGLAHDTVRNCAYVPIMNGQGTETRENCNSLWNEFPEFQVKGTVSSLAVLRAPNYYDYAVPLQYRSLFPTGTFLKNLDVTHIATTPYYKPGVDMSQTIADALITQYNIKQKPTLATSLANNPAKPDMAPGRRSGTAEGQKVTCIISKE